MTSKPSRAAAAAADPQETHFPAEAVEEEGRLSACTWHKKWLIFEDECPEEKMLAFHKPQMP